MTVLYPFVPPDRINQLVLDRLAEAVGSVPAFDVTLARLSWFGHNVLWLAPEPEHPFRALTTAVWERFPDHPPYRGAHADLVPHLTIGADASLERLQRAAMAIRPLLPIRSHVAAARLMQGSPDAGTWHTIAALPLAAATDCGR